MSSLGRSGGPVGQEVRVGGQGRRSGCQDLNREGGCGEGD